MNDKHITGTSRYWTYHNDRSPSILMIHGFRGTHHGLEEIIKNLPEFRAIVPDLPGFGESEEFDGKHDLKNYLRFVGEIQAITAAEKPQILLGHSFGSIIAAQYAATHPNKVDRLILINPISAPALHGPKATMTRLAILYYWLGRKLPAPASKKWLSSPLIVDIMSGQMTVSKERQLRDFIYQQHRQHFSQFASPRVVAEAFRASVEHTVTEVAPQLTMPTLVIGAEKDQVSSHSSQRALATSLAHATYVELQNVGHLVHYEKPTEAAAAIRTFLTS